jgi:hypothetical protein
MEKRVPVQMESIPKIFCLAFLLGIEFSEWEAADRNNLDRFMAANVVSEFVKYVALFTSWTVVRIGDDEAGPANDLE